MYLFTRRAPGQHLRGRGGGGVLPAVRAVPGGGGDTGQAAGSLDTAITPAHFYYRSVRTIQTICLDTVTIFHSVSYALI